MRFGYYGYGMGMMGTGRLITMGIFCLMVLLLLVFCTVVSIRMLRHHRKPKAETAQAYRADSTQYSTISTNSALNILNDRYARGEITSEEYQKIKADINS